MRGCCGPLGMPSAALSDGVASRGAAGAPDAAILPGFASCVAFGFSVDRPPSAAGAGADGKGAGPGSTSGSDGLASRGGTGIVRHTPHDGQSICWPVHSVFTTMRWPQVGQSNLNSSVAGISNGVRVESGWLSAWFNMVFINYLLLPLSICRLVKTGRPEKTSTPQNLRQPEN